MRGAVMMYIVGVTQEGKKELVAVDPGYRESEESWSILLRDLKSRGLESPILAIGDGALGFWKAIGNVYPAVKKQRCWIHSVSCKRQEGTYDIF